MVPRNPAFGFTLVATAAMLFIVNAGMSRVVLRAGLEPATLTTLRVTATFVVLLVLLAIFRRGALRPPTGRLALLLVAHGTIGVAALQWTYYIAIDRLPVGMALLLEYQAPILVAVWARFVQNEPVRHRMWAGLALAMLGLAAATGIWKGAVFDPVGIAAGFGAAVCFAAYFLLGEHGVGSLDPMQMILWSFFVASIGLNVVSPVTAETLPLLGEHVSLLGSLAAYDAPVWLLLCWIIALGTITPFALELFALRHLRATTVTMVAMLETVGVSALGWLWFFERLDAIALVGGLAVVAGIVLAQTARQPRVVIEPPHLN